MIGFFQECRFNLYIYAPKDDPFHREHWREPYPKEQLITLKALIDAAKELINFCSFCFFHKVF